MDSHPVPQDYKISHQLVLDCKFNLFKFVNTLLKFRKNNEDQEELVTNEQLTQKANEIFKINDELDEAISGLDHQLDQKLKKQEHDYLKGYSMYVKQKE